MPEIDITEPTVFGIGGGSTPTAYSPLPVTSPETAWDVSIGGYTFMYSAGAEDILIRQTSDYRRTRIDQEREPGEQSLDSGFWLRSQTSYHYGAGSSSNEPVETDAAVARFQFFKSAGVDVWTPGEVRLLPATSRVQASTASAQFAVATATGVLFAAGTKLWHVTNAGQSTEITWGGSGAITSLATDGTNWYAGTSGAIYKGSLPSGTGAAMITGFSGNPLVRWVKSRLMVAIGQAVYELTPSSTTLPTPLYTHPTSGWTWTDFDEGPTSIYAAGYGNSQSSIFRIGILVDQTTTPVTVNLAPPVVVTELPRGELVQNIYGYLGSFLGVGTSKGVRVAVIDANGSLALGPVIVQVPGGCFDMVGADRFLYVSGGRVQSGSNSTASGLYRIDLGAEISAGRYAYAADMVAAGEVTNVVAVTANADKVFFAVAESGLFAQQSTTVSEGWLLPGKIQFSTLERKAWRSLRGFADPTMTGQITFYVDDDGSGDPATWSQVGQLSSDFPTNDFGIGTLFVEPSQQLWVGIKLTSGAILQGWQVRAVPAPRRTRLIQTTLMCFDYETNRNGLRTGADGAAWMRVQALEDLEDAAAPVLFTDYTTGEAVQVVIERVQFNRRTPPSRQNKNAGGVLSVLMRTV